MDQNQDFSALRNLLASTRLDMPQDTQVEQFLVEFHRRQRAQLLVPQSIWSRAMGWLTDKAAGFEFAPSLSYASVAAAIAITAFVGLSQQVQIKHVDGQSKLAFRMAPQDASFAMVPASFAPSATASPKLSVGNPNFTATRSDSSAPRYVLANSQGDHDATVAF